MKPLRGQGVGRGPPRPHWKDEAWKPPGETDIAESEGPSGGVPPGQLGLRDHMASVRTGLRRNRFLPPASLFRNPESQPPTPSCSFPSILTPAHLLPKLLETPPPSPSPSPVPKPTPRSRTASTPSSATSRSPKTSPSPSPVPSAALKLLLYPSSSPSCSPRASPSPSPNVSRSSRPSTPRVREEWPALPCAGVAGLRAGRPAQVRVPVPPPSPVPVPRSDPRPSSQSQPPRPLPSLLLSQMPRPSSSCSRVSRVSSTSSSSPTPSFRPQIPALMSLVIPPPQSPNIPSRVSSPVPVSPPRSPSPRSGITPEGRAVPAAIWCWNCHAKGHRHRECPWPRGMQYCHYCGARGRNLARCPGCSALWRETRRG